MKHLVSTSDLFNARKPVIREKEEMINQKRHDTPSDKKYWLWGSNFILVPSSLAGMVKRMPNDGFYVWFMFFGLMEIMWRRKRLIKVLWYLRVHPKLIGVRFYSVLSFKLMGLYGQRRCFDIWEVPMQNWHLIHFDNNKNENKLLLK